MLEVTQPVDPPTPIVPDAPATPADPDPGTPAAPEEPATVPGPDEPATPIDPDPGTDPDPEPDPDPGPDPEPGRAPAETARERRTHHELCFGCGLGNVFGLHLELEHHDAAGLSGRFFVKQDHQGFDGQLHRGVLLAALEEALALAGAGGGAGRTGAAGGPTDTTGARFVADFHRSAPLGTFVRVQTAAAEDGVARARAFGEHGELLAEGRLFGLDSRAVD